MTNHERFVYYESGALQESVEINLLDWAGYWTTAGTSGITDPLLKAQTEAAIMLILNDLATIVRSVSALAISDPAIQQAAPDGVTESMISSAVTAIMTNKLSWITGITALPE